MGSVSAPIAQMGPMELRRGFLATLQEIEKVKSTYLVGDVMRLSDMDATIAHQQLVTLYGNLELAQQRIEELDTAAEKT